MYSMDNYLQCSYHRDLRQCLAKLRLSSHKFLVERGRWVKHKINYHERLCTLCDENDCFPEKLLNFIVHYVAIISNHNFIVDFKKITTYKLETKKINTTLLPQTFYNWHHWHQVSHTTWSNLLILLDQNKPSHSTTFISIWWFCADSSVRVL